MPSRTQVCGLKLGSGVCAWRCACAAVHVSGVRGQLVDLSAPLLPFWLQDGTQISSLAISIFTCWAILPAPNLKTFQFIRMIWSLDKMKNLRLLLKVCLARPLIPLLQLLEPHIGTLDLEQAEQVEKEAEQVWMWCPETWAASGRGVQSCACLIHVLALPAVGAPDPPLQFYPWTLLHFLLFCDSLLCLPVTLLCAVPAP